MNMIIKIARAYGMCFGVRDALATAEKMVHQAPLTVLGEIVHNPVATKQLKALGLKEGNLDGFTSATERVLVTAHGAADIVKAQWQQSGHTVIDATCPLVRRAHTELRRLVTAGYHPVVIGQKNHVEVRGLAGDFPGATVLEVDEDINGLPEGGALGVISQTTQPITRVREVLDQIRRFRPNQAVHFCDTVCQPTKDRQSALEDLCALVQLVVVVGGRTSHNTRQLAATARSYGCLAVHVEEASQLQACWFREIDRVGVTAGTSTLETTFQDVVQGLRQMARAKGFGMQGAC
jgi:4-hydroxy-3-methylbut-2-enyl diphosphate reductase